jgi:hypothetical protein
MVQATDIGMRIFSFAGGVIAIIEAVLLFLGTKLAFWDFGWISGLVGIILGLLALFLAIKALPHMPFYLAVIGIALIILAVIIGGIVVLIAFAIGAFT